MIQAFRNINVDHLNLMYDIKVMLLNSWDASCKFVKDSINFLEPFQTPLVSHKIE
jgi:hypothetical protein